MKNQKEMMEALLAGERLVGIAERSANEYWLDKRDGRIYYQNTKEDTFPCRCNGIPTFDKLQVKPKTISINSIEVPEPMRVKPKRGEEYWIPAIYYAVDTIVDYFEWGDDKKDNRMLSMGLVHRTKEAAELHAKALLSFTEREG